MKRLLALSVLIFIVGFIGNAYAPDEQKFKVYVEVMRNEPDEEKTENDIIETHLKRELRDLGDVKIVDEMDDWQFRIKVATLGQLYKDGSKTPLISIAATFDTRVPKSLFKSYNFIVTPVYSDNIRMAYWFQDNLPEWCIRAAGAFDKGILKIYR